MPSILVKPLPAKRRAPTQERAERTISTFFEAIAQIVKNDSEARFSTNKIAERAGFSIGTLYQYFPTKEALMFAMIKRDRARVQQQLADVLAQDELADSDPYLLVKEFIHVLVHAYASDRKLRRAMVKFAWQMDQGESMIELNRESSDRIAIALARFSDRAATRLVNAAPRLHMRPATLFVLTRAVSGVIRSASIEESDLLGTPEFEEGLVQLAWGMLADGVAGATP